MGRRLRVGVVGGGVAGCAAALMLARDGHRVDLFEQTPRIGPVGAGILLQPAGQHVLAGLGLLDAIAARSARIHTLVAHTHRGKRLSHLVYADRGEHLFALGVHRADLFATMHDACVDAGVRIHLGRTVSQTRVDRRGRRLLFADAAVLDGFDLVVAADGSRSRLRATGGPRAFTHAYRPAALWAVGHSEWPRDELVQYTRGTDELCGLLPMGDGRCSFFWGIRARRPGDDACTWRRDDFDAWRERVIRLAPPAEPVVRSLRGWDDLMFAGYRMTFMPRAVADRLVFIGDAAHSAGPHLGQGANLALLDAAGLRDALRVAGGRDVAGALDRYNGRQRLRNAYYTLATAALMPSFQGSGHVIGIARDLVLPALQRIGPIRQAMLRTLCGG